MPDLTVPGSHTPEQIDALADHLYDREYSYPIWPNWQNVKDAAPTRHDAANLQERYLDLASYILSSQVIEERDRQFAQEAYDEGIQAFGRSLLKPLGERGTRSIEPYPHPKEDLRTVIDGEHVG